MITSIFIFFIFELVYKAEKRFLLCPFLMGLKEFIVYLQPQTGPA